MKCLSHRVDHAHTELTRHLFPGDGGSFRPTQRPGFGVIVGQCDANEPPKIGRWFVLHLAEATSSPVTRPPQLGEVMDDDR